MGDTGTVPTARNATSVASVEDVGWRRRLLCDAIDLSLLSILSAGVSSHIATAAATTTGLASAPPPLLWGAIGPRWRTRLLALEGLGTTVVSGAGNNSSPSSFVWLGPGLGFLAASRLHAANSFLVGCIYYATCHLLWKGRSVGMLATGLSLAPGRVCSIVHGGGAGWGAQDHHEDQLAPGSCEQRVGLARLLFRWLAESLLSGAAARWQWWSLVDVALLWFLGGNEYLHDLASGCRVVRHRGRGDSESSGD
jgi:hypothetical protein